MSCVKESRHTSQASRQVRIEKRSRVMRMNDARAQVPAIAASFRTSPGLSPGGLPSEYTGHCRSSISVASVPRLPGNECQIESLAVCEPGEFHQQLFHATDIRAERNVDDVRPAWTRMCGAGRPGMAILFDGSIISLARGLEGPAWCLKLRAYLFFNRQELCHLRGQKRRTGRQMRDVEPSLG